MLNFSILIEVYLLQDASEAGLGTYNAKAAVRDAARSPSMLASTLITALLALVCFLSLSDAPKVPRASSCTPHVYLK
jgi:hypothetical protein